MSHGNRRHHILLSHTLSVLTGGMMLTLLASLMPAAEARERDSLAGPYPYDFPSRASTQGSLLLQEARRRNPSGPASGQASGGSGNPGGDVQAGAIVNNNSTSIAVGNWQQIEMTLGDGAEGLIMTESHQTNQAEANALSKIRNTLEMDAQKTATALIESTNRSSQTSE